MKRRHLLGLSAMALAWGPSPALWAQAAAKGTFTAPQLDQILAPIALYPDTVLAQTLQAASYPLEIVEAARWSQANPNLKGDAAVAAVKDKEWDVSVKSLAAFPQILSMMNNNLDWTQKIGDAMIGQPKDVADSVQRLRAKAAAAGNLKTTPQQKVTTQAAPSSGQTSGSSGGSGSAIVIEPANPELIYVPYYNPTWAYGPWPYPTYPPVYYPPPSYYGTALMTGMMFGLGVAAGSAMYGGWHWGWSGNGWGNSYTTVNVNRATSISANNFNASRYNNGQWQHDAAHRDGVPYRTAAERQQYNQVRAGAQQREQFRGQLDGTNRAQAATTRDQAATNRDQAATNRAQTATQDRAAQDRATQGRSSAFDGVDRGQAVNRDYDRGRSSYGDRSFNRGGGGGFERGGGGFERGGGGRR
ncbi:hypothetical protein BH11PSE3_BH11PSE3_32160 [soil metagenome]